MSKNPQISNKLDFKKLKVFGLVTNLPEHRLAWLLNKEFDWDMERFGDLLLDNDHYVIVNNDKIDEIAQDVFSFPLHTFNDEGNKFVVDLVRNKGGTGTFFQELKQFDYLLLFHGEFDYLPENMTGKIRKLSQVQVVMEIPVDKMKDKHFLVSYK